LKKTFRDYLTFAIVAIVMIALDQITKTIIRQNMDLSQIWFPFGIEGFYPYFYFTHWYNTGVSFGMFQDANMFFAGLSIVISIILIVIYIKMDAEDKTIHVALSLILGGAIGNLIDRVTVGHVTDFIAMGSFPIFNIADASVSIGVVIMLVAMWLKEKGDGQPDETEQTQDA
jgi:signal peptidase II